MILVQLVLHLDNQLALAQRRLAEANVFGALDALDTALLQRLDPSPDAFGQAQPREAKRHRDAGHQRGDPQHARAGEAEQLHAQRPERVAEHAAGVTARQLRLPLVHARPLERRARAQQQHDADPEQSARPMGLVRGDELAAAQHARQCAKPRAQAHEHQPPDRIAEQKKREVGRPRAKRTGLIVQRRRGP